MLPLKGSGYSPWSFAQQSLPYFANKNGQLVGLANEIRKQYDVIAEIVAIAIDQGVTIKIPLQGDSIGPFRVLTPSLSVYSALMPQFPRTPEPDKDALEAIGMWLGSKPSGLQRALEAIFEKAVAAVQHFIPESWATERLKDGGVTSASNESSLVLYGVFENGPILLTGDAGVWALTWAAKSRLCSWHFARALRSDPDSASRQQKQCRTDDIKSNPRPYSRREYKAWHSGLCFCSGR